MTNKAYDKLKLTALVIIPCIALVITFLSSILNIWEIPNADKIIASLVALDTLLGATVKVLSDSYNRKKQEEKEEFKRLNGQDGENG